jgi:hypothetical protein
MHPATKIDEIPVEGLPFKIMEPRPPVIEFAAQRLHFDNGRLGLNIFSQDDSVVFGLEISVERLAKGTRNRNVLLFQQICGQLRERSRPCVFVSGEKRLRTRLNVSNSFGPEINRHAYLRKCGLRVVAP